MESPLQAWLTLQRQMIAGAEAALVVLGTSEHAPNARVARCPAGAPANARLSATVEIARERGTLAVQEPGASGDPTQASTYVAVPVTHEGCVAGAVGVEMRGLQPGDFKALAGLLQWCARGLELLLDAEGGQRRLSAHLAVAGTVLDCEYLGEAAHALASELARSLGCERVAVGLRRRGRLRVTGLSSGMRFKDETEPVRDLVCAMEEALDQDAVLELPVPADGPPHVTTAHEALAQSTGAGAVCTVPLASRGHAVGALTCEWDDPIAFDATLCERLRDAGLLCGPLLELMRRAEADPIERGRAWLTRFVEHHFGADRSLAKAVGIAVALLLLVLVVAPAPYRISARASLEGRVQRALVAAVDGYLSEANARPGDLVAAGDVLARLDDRDLRLERRKWESQKAQLEKEYREALAGGDRTQVSILRAQIDASTAQLGLADEQLSRTTVTAPFDGVILEGDLNRSLGSPVEQGTVLFELAPLDGYRIILQVDDRDIADVTVGQTGRLTLSALPGQAHPLTVERITPISTTEDGRNYFRVEAVLEEPVEALRPGMEGIARIDAGRRQLLWIWTHEMIDWLRLWTWSFLP